MTVHLNEKQANLGEIDIWFLGYKIEFILPLLPGQIGSIKEITITMNRYNINLHLRGLLAPETLLCSSIVSYPLRRYFAPAALLSLSNVQCGI